MLVHENSREHEICVYLDEYFDVKHSFIWKKKERKWMIFPYDYWELADFKLSKGEENCANVLSLNQRHWY